MKKYILYALLLITAACEKGIDSVEYPSTVYLPKSGIVDVAPLLGESVYQISIYKAGINQNESAVDVYLQIDKDSLERYVAANAEQFELLPEKYYDIPTTKVRLEGERTTINIRLLNIDERFVNRNYVLPISIEAVSPLVSVEPSKKAVFLIMSAFRNIYAGDYKVNGTITDSATGETVTKIDENVSATSVTANSIIVKGAENNMNLMLTVKGDGSVSVAGASGSENYEITDMSGFSSKYTGAFDQLYQRSWGVYDVYYQYSLNSAVMYVHTQYKSWH
jgi:hypothetical protein